MTTVREQALARSIERLSARSFEDLLFFLMGNDAGYSSSSREHVRRKLLQFAQENFYAGNQDDQ